MAKIDIINFIDSLPDDTKVIDLCNLNLSYIPVLTRFTKLKHLSCASNQLTYLPTLPNNLMYLNCFNNKLVSLPTLPESLIYLNCFDNNLTYFPNFPDKLIGLFCFDNPITPVLYCYDLNVTKQKVKRLNSFRYLYYCLKFKKRFRKFLWEKVREPKIMKQYHPSYLEDHLNENGDLDDFLEKW